MELEQQRDDLNARMGKEEKSEEDLNYIKEKKEHLEQREDELFQWKLDLK